MTNIPITGKIISVEVTDEEAPFSYAEYSDDSSTDPKTIIEPTGNRISLIKLVHSIGVVDSGAGFILSDDFEIGDIVEFFSVTNNPPYGTQVQVYDNNNHNLLLIGSSDPIRKVSVVKKVFSETGNDWIVYGIA